MGVHNSTCQEFGLLTPRTSKEFCGHESCMNCRSNVLLPPSVLGTSGGGGGVNGSICQDGNGGRGCLSRGPMGKRWRSANNGRGRRRNGRDARRRRREAKLRERREEGRDGNGKPHAWRCQGGTCLMERGGSNCDCGGGVGDGDGGGTDKEACGLPTCGRKRRGGLEMMPRRGEDNPL